MLDSTTRLVEVPSAYRLKVSVAPAAWVGERSCRHAWIDDSLVWCGREGERSVWRQVCQPKPGQLEIDGSADPALDATWISNTLHPDATVASWEDPVLVEIATRFPGLAPYGDGSLFEGIITSIVGQSISVAAAAVTQRRLSLLFDDFVEVNGRTFAPLPSPVMLAGASVEMIRSSGVTTRRADALNRIARMAVDGELPSDEMARSDPEMVAKELVALPQIGKWTAESTLLWGVGAPDAWPTGDVALLRAMKLAFDNPDLTLASIDQMAEAWRPHRGIAARLFWTNLFELAK